MNRAYQEGGEAAAALAAARIAQQLAAQKAAADRVREQHGMADQDALAAAYRLGGEAALAAKLHEQRRARAMAQTNQRPAAAPRANEQPTTPTASREEPAARDTRGRRQRFEPPQPQQPRPAEPRTADQQRAEALARLRRAQETVAQQARQWSAAPRVNEQPTTSPDGRRGGDEKHRPAPPWWERNAPRDESRERRGSPRRARQGQGPTPDETIGHRARDNRGERTVPVGGNTERIGGNEASRVFRRVEIRGDQRITNLTPDKLRSAGLLPRHRLTVEDRSIWFSRGFDIGGDRAAVIGYVRTDDDRIVARSYYRSNSSGAWRYLPQYQYTNDTERVDDGRVTWYSKGHGEESVTLPAKLQEGLARSMADDGPILRLDRRVSKEAFIGTARQLNAEGTVYHGRVSQKPEKLRGVPGSAGQLPAPDAINIDPEQAPRFDRNIASWEQETGLYGKVGYEVFTSADGRFSYTFCKDSRGRTWIGSIEDLSSPVESTGLRTRWISSALTTPAYEYDGHDSGYGDPNDGSGHYVDMFNNYLSHVPVIKEYLARPAGANQRRR